MTGQRRTLRSDAHKLVAAISAPFEPVQDKGWNEQAIRTPAQKRSEAVVTPASSANPVLRSPMTSRKRGVSGLTALSLLAALLATMAGPLRPAGAAQPSFPLYLPVPVGTTVMAGGPHAYNGVSETPRSAIDFGMPGGANMSVHAAAGGTARIVASGGYNCIVEIDHADGWQTRYLHLKNVPPGINRQPVVAGQHIGDAGQGKASNPRPGDIPQETCGASSRNFRHVHFALFKGGAEQNIDGTSIGGYTVHQNGDSYCGYWTRDHDGARVVRQTCIAILGLKNDLVTPNNPPPVQPPTAHNPVGYLDVVERTSGGVRLAGWARDDDNAGAALQIQALIDGNPVGATATAGNFRPDGGIGNHGFDFAVPMDDKAHNVCARAINVGGGADAVLLGCVQVQQLFYDPEGRLDSATRIDGGSIRVIGWASDRDIAGPIQVQALVDGAVAGQTTANVSRSDVGAHGFNFVVPTDWRSRQVCAKALNAGGGGVDVVLPDCVQVPYAICPATAPTMVSTKFKDDILPTPGDDVVWASGGGARIAGSAGNDIICGGGATGGPGGNQIIGGPGDNLIFSGPGNNDVVAGPGRTTVISGGGHNRIAVCQNTVVLNRSAQDEIRPSANCGARVGSQPTDSVPPVTLTPSADAVTTTPSTAPPATIPATPPPTTATPEPAPPPPSPPAAQTVGGGPALCGASTSQAGSAYTVTGSGDGVAVRQGPSPHHPVSYTLSEGDSLAVVCYVNGVPVEGNTRWNRLSDGLWVADAYVKPNS